MSSQANSICRGVIILPAIQHADSTDEMQHSHLFPVRLGPRCPNGWDSRYRCGALGGTQSSRSRPAFSRLRAFMWFATIVAGMTVRTELLGVTSIVRALNLRPNLYNLLRKHFHSSAVKLDRLWPCGCRRCCGLSQVLCPNGRVVLVADGINPKRGKKMPAVKLLHQQSESNTSPSTSSGIPCRPSAYS